VLGESLEDLEESRNRYAALYDFAPVGYVTFDHKGCIQEINLTGASLIGTYYAASHYLSQLFVVRT
jgi:PAS domain-containing protein